MSNIISPKASDVCLGHLSHFRKSVADARNAALEDAAKVADEKAAREGQKYRDLAGMADDFERGVLKGASIACESVAAAIRAMKVENIPG